MNDWARVYELSGHLYLLLTALPVRSDYIALLSRGEGVSLRPDATLCSEGENAQTGKHRKRAAVAETAWSCLSRRALLTMAGRTASKLSTQQASGRARHRVLLLACAAQTCKLALLLLAGALLPDYDTSASLRPFSCFPESAQQVSQQGSRSPSTQHAADSTGRAGHALPHWSQPAWSLVVWDSVFYADIACGGYRFEQQYAFFPLLPGA